MAETQTHTEVPAGGKEIFPPFQKETFPSQLFWLAITFVALYVVMARIALPQIGAIFQARRERISGDLAEAERTIAATKSAAMANVHTIAAEAAAAIVERLIGAAPADAAVNAAVEDALKG